jgi:hypothetical protein
MCCTDRFDLSPVSPAIVHVGHAGGAACHQRCHSSTRWLCRWQLSLLLPPARLSPHQVHGPHPTATLTTVAMPAAPPDLPDPAPMTDASLATWLEANVWTLGP